MRYIIERNEGPAGFEKVLERIETEDGKFAGALDALKMNIITPFAPDHQGQSVQFEAVRPTFATATLPGDTETYMSGWTCMAACPEEGFDL